MSVVMSEHRRAERARLAIPTLVEGIGQRELTLPPSLAAVYERVQPSRGDLGEKFPAVLRDLSTNGAFLSGLPLPLLSRVAFTFPLEGFGQVDVLGWTLWRRSADCEILIEGAEPIRLRAGFGVLFEAISLDARRAIADLVARVGD